MAVGFSKEPQPHAARGPTLPPGFGCAEKSPGAELRAVVGADFPPPSLAQNLKVMTTSDVSAEILTGADTHFLLSFVRVRESVHGGWAGVGWREAVWQRYGETSWQGSKLEKRAGETPLGPSILFPYLLQLSSPHSPKGHQLPARG